MAPRTTGSSSENNAAFLDPMRDLLRIGSVITAQARGLPYQRLAVSYAPYDDV